MDFDNIDFWEMVQHYYNCTPKELIHVKERDPNDSYWYLNDKSNPSADMELRIDVERNYPYPKTHEEACKAFERQYYDYLYDKWVDSDNSESEYNVWCNVCDPTPHGICI